VSVLADLQKVVWRLRCFGTVTALAFLSVVVAHGQVGAPGSLAQKFDKRAFGIIPNYRTADASAPFRPLTTSQKVAIAAKDSFDWPPMLTAAAYAGLGQFGEPEPILWTGWRRIWEPPCLSLCGPSDGKSLHGRIHAQFAA
jgi:hypothetical protein